jgi:putative NIF3 family GTP cyclohydrolase 1 type 2
MDYRKPPPILPSCVYFVSNHTLSDPSSAHTREVIKPITDLVGFEGAGYGKIVRFERAVRLDDLVDRICAGLGRLQGVSVATSQLIPSGMRSGIEINSIGICAGSGGSMLNGLDVDMYFTGELSHHEALAAIEQDKVVVTAFHSNTERVFLRERMRQQLQMGIAEQLTLRTDVMDDVDDLPGMPGSFEVAVSEIDRDPYEIIVAGQTGW